MDLASIGPEHELVGFDGHCGLRYESVGAGETRAFVTIGPQHLQPAGLVHGGLYATIAETMASVGTLAGNEGQHVAGMSNHTTFLRPAFEGDTLRAVARPRHTGRTTWVWDVDVTGDAGKLVATARVTIAVRDPR